MKPVKVIKIVIDTIMYLLFILLIGLMIRACTLPGADEGLKGNFQMLPRPTAEPAAERIKPSLEPN